jgi:hypothetical protein
MVRANMVEDREAFVATQFLTHLFDKIFGKSKNSEK